MPYASTKKIINEVLINNIRNKYFYNSHRSFKFKNNRFYSYDTVIAEFMDESNYLHIHKKTARLGEFVSYTTSKQVNYIIKCCIDNHIPHNLDKDYDWSNSLEDIEFKEEEGHECPITYQIITHGLKTKCGHIFEKVALKQWLKSKSQCPMCRTEL